MADPKEINYKPLTTSLNGEPHAVTSTDPTNPTIAHTHSGGVTDADLVILMACNTDTVTQHRLTVLIYTGLTASNPGSIVNVVDLPPGGGAFVVLDGAWLSGGYKIGLSADVATQINYWGRAPKGTLGT